MNFFHR